MSVHEIVKRTNTQEATLIKPCADGGSSAVTGRPATQPKALTAAQQGREVKFRPGVSKDGMLASPISQKRALAVNKGAK